MVTSIFAQINKKLRYLVELYSFNLLYLRNAQPFSKNGNASSFSLMFIRVVNFLSVALFLNVTFRAWVVDKEKLGAFLMSFNHACPLSVSIGLFFRNMNVGNLDVFNVDEQQI